MWVRDGHTRLVSGEFPLSWASWSAIPGGDSLVQTIASALTLILLKVGKPSFTADH